MGDERIAAQGESEARVSGLLSLFERIAAQWRLVHSFPSPADAETMNLYLKKLSAGYPDRKMLLIMDQGSW